MKTSSRLAIASAAAVALAGCFTISQTEYPQVVFSRPSGDAPAIAISGFAATYTTYTPVYGYATVWESTPGYYRRGRYYDGWCYPRTVSTTTYVPETGVTTEYAEKAQEAFESAGFVVAPSNAVYVVDVKFSGPVVTDGDRTASAATLILSLFTADYTHRVWNARLKVTDAATGRVLLHKNYDQDYAASIWGPLPIFSPAGAQETDLGYIKNWCLSALTDRTVADASAFIAAQTEAK